MKYLFTHTDLDGVGCAVLAKLAFGEDVRITYCDYDYVDAIIHDFIDEVCLSEEENDKVFITDISISNWLAEKIDECNARFYVRLMDHHKTAEYLNKYDWCEVTTHKENLLETIPTCGTELFYAYLTDMGYLSKGNKIIREFVNFVRDYDTWRWKDFENGKPIKEFNDLLYILGRDAFIERCMSRFKGNRHIVEFSKDERAMLDKRQAEIDEYVINKSFELDVHKVDGVLCGVVFAEKYFSELGNRLCEEFKDTINFVMMIDMGKRVVHYRTIHDDVDVSEVAKAFGGGGHPPAAGNTFTRDQRWNVIDCIIDQMKQREERKHGMEELVDKMAEAIEIEKEQRSLKGRVKKLFGKGN